MKLTEIFTFENLYNVHKKCRLSKQHKGEVVRFEIDLARNISSLVKEFEKGTYKAGEYKYFIICDPKVREVEALKYKDRVVIRCFCENALIPRLQNKLVLDNSACQKNKGTLFARNRLIKFLRAEHSRNRNNDFYYLKCDIRKYFPSINHQILIWQLAEQGFSKEELEFMWQFIKAGKHKNEEQGLPLGNQTSQWFALLYLNKLDRLIKEKLRVKCYVRYMDDFILIHKNKKFLQNCKKQIEVFCNNELKLELNQKTQIGKVSNGINFLGFKHSVLPSGKVDVRLVGKARVRLKKHIKNLSKLKEMKLIDKEYLKPRTNAFLTHIKYSNESKNLKIRIKGLIENNFE